MSAESSDGQDLLQNADQLFDENKYQEAVDILKKHTVKFDTFFLLKYGFQMFNKADANLFIQRTESRRCKCFVA